LCDLAFVKQEAESAWCGSELIRRLDLLTDTLNVVFGYVRHDFFEIIGFYASCFLCFKTELQTKQGERIKKCHDFATG